MYRDEEHLRALKLRNKLESLKRKSPVTVKVNPNVDIGGNREVFDKIRNKRFPRIYDAEMYILANYGSGTRPVFTLKSDIDVDKELKRLLKSK